MESEMKKPDADLASLWSGRKWAAYLATRSSTLSDAASRTLIRTAEREARIFSTMRDGSDADCGGATNDGDGPSA